MNTQKTTEQSFEHWSKTTVSIFSVYSPRSVNSSETSTVEKPPRRVTTVAQSKKDGNNSEVLKLNMEN